MIRFEHVAYSYDKIPFIEDMNISFEKGRITAIIGPNGSGKSTVIKLLARLLNPSRGRIFLNGQDISSIRRKLFAREISVLLQSSHIPDMTVEQAVRSGRYPYQSFLEPASHEDQLITEQAIAMADCNWFREKPMCQLSGGERQRVFLAMILAQDTPVILLDEPTAYLDINVSYDMMELIRELNEKMGKTVVMVLHDMNLALNYADQVILMDQGRIVSFNSAADQGLHERIGETFGVKIQSVSQEEESQFYYLKR